MTASAARRALLLACLFATPFSATGCSFLASTHASLFKRFPYVNHYLKLRGPDHTGTLARGGFAFVHNLLHMTGQFTPQPFVSADNNTVALFNGEIYNFRKLEPLLRPNGPPYPSDGACILEVGRHRSNAMWALYITSALLIVRRALDLSPARMHRRIKNGARALHGTLKGSSPSPSSISPSARSSSPPTPSASSRSSWRSRPTRLASRRVRPAASRPRQNAAASGSTLGAALPCCVTFAFPHRFWPQSYHNPIAGHGARARCLVC